jgi:hypothetical protein
MNENVCKSYGIWERRQQCTLYFQACFKEWVLGTHRSIDFLGQIRGCKTVRGSCLLGGLN